MIDLNKLKKITLGIYEKRRVNGANLGADHLKHCAGEVVEATVAKISYTTNLELAKGTGIFTENVKIELAKLKLDYAHELADIIVCVLNEAEIATIDIEKAILEVVEKNRLRAEGKGDKK